MRASLALLELGPDTITAAVLGAIYRAPLGEPSPIDFALHLTGPTGAFKTELAALAQAHFGAAFNGRRLPASWADTANMLEKKAFLAKDAVLVVDDFAPTGTTTDVSGCIARPIACSVPPATAPAVPGCAPTAAAGQPTIRAAAHLDRRGHPERPEPAGSPPGARADPGRDPGRPPLGRAGRRGERAVRCCHGGISALACPSHRRSQGDAAGAATDAARHAGPGIDHRRTPDIAASLILGWETFLRFAEEAGAISRDDAAALLTRVRAALTESAEVQRAHQASEEPATRFLALLGAAISSGRAHLADAETGASLRTPPAGAGGSTSSVQADEREVWRPNGERLGWIREEDLLLDPDTAFAAAQKLARDQGTSIPIKQRTLWKRLAEQGLLASRDQARGSRCASRSRACGAICCTFDQHPRR